MAIKNKITNKKSKKSRGFALFIAVVFMSVMLTMGLELGSLGYKQEILASDAIRSQNAFYVADTALECALYADQQKDIFDYTTHSSGPPALITSVICNDVGAATQLSYSYDVNRLLVSERLPLDGGTHCADVMVSKPNPTLATPVTQVFSQGYDVPCASVGVAGVRFASRGLGARY